ncbi:MAG: ATP-dependent protease ATPase subunit HslU [Bacteroidetes bacterium]|nr:MAG: ATP-dependent protease ATPase subunit HslU [Bacteroidota bacterium]
MIDTLTPRQIVEELDKYIIGQHDAKRNVAIALRNRWRRLNASPEMQKEIMPNNILMIGATGVGKTEIARRLAKLADAPFVKVEASKFTEVGYVGRDVESMVRDLVEQAVHMIKKRKTEEVKQKAEEAVEALILDLLIPPLNANPPKRKSSKKEVDLKSVDMMEVLKGFDLKKSEEEQPSAEDIELNQRTRDKFKEKLKNREIEDKKVDIEVPQHFSTNVGVVGPIGMDDSSMQGIQDMISGMLPKNKKKRKVTIAEARKILLDEEASKLIDMEDVKIEAINKTENSGIIFIDEIDKIARSSSKGSGPDVSREGVQRDLLPIVEGSSVSTKYGVVNTDYILFIAAGAFHVSKPSDLIPELQGRFPIRVELQSLSKADFILILKTPKNALTKQYFALMESEGVEISFEDSAIEKIAEIAFEVNSEVENIGARRLHTVMSTLLNEFLYEIPDTIKPGSVLKIDADLVNKRLSGLVKNKDLSRYIL